MDVIIIGGGVMGLLTARELAVSGARVALLEKQVIGQESSWAGGGILSPLYPWRAAEAVTALCRWSQAAYPNLAETLKESTGIDPEWTRSGLLVSDCEAIGQAKLWCEAQAVEHAELMLEEFARLEPELRLTPHNPLHLPGIAQIRNPRLLKALHADLTKLGVQFLENHEVSEIDIERSRVKGVVTRQGVFTADYYVVSAGAWSALLGRAVLRGIRVVPVKGQMLVFKARPDLLRHIVLSEGHYLIPRRDGRILAGSTVEHTQFNKGTTEVARRALAGFARAALPALRECVIEKHWAGLRPGSPEGIPYIGDHPEIPNLFFNCGHFRNGFVMAPASARLLTDLVLNRHPIVPPEPYRIPASH